MDQGWVRFQRWAMGDAELVVDLGSTKRLDWIGAHVLGIAAPASSTSVDFGVVFSKTRWAGTKSAAGARKFQVAMVIRSYQYKRDGASCRYVKVLFSSSEGLFVSEIELTQAALSEGFLASK